MGSSESYTQFWRVWATGDQEDVALHGLTHLGVDEGAARRTPLYGSEEITPVVHRALLRLGRKGEAAVLARAVKAWVDSRRTDYMPAGLRRAYTELLADARRSPNEPPAVTTDLGRRLRQDVLELKLARALGLGVPDDLRDHAADLLRLLATGKTSTPWG